MKICQLDLGVDTSLPIHPLLLGEKFLIENCLERGQLPIYTSNDGNKEKTRPTIGITMGAIETHFAVRKNYQHAVEQAGGKCVFIPHVDHELAKEYAQMIDGVIFSGGGDIHPKRWGDKIRGAGSRQQTIDEVRDEFEIALINEIEKIGKPILGVCRGMQLINVCRGGTLLQGPPSSYSHMPISNNYEGMIKNIHHMLVTPNTRLADFSETTSRVNSGHHMSIYTLGKELISSGRYYDRTIEAIEGTGDNFVMGVQWHPEAMLDSKLTQGLLGEFMGAVREVRN